MTDTEKPAFVLARLDSYIAYGRELLIKEINLQEKKINPGYKEKLEEGIRRLEEIKEKFLKEVADQ